VDPAGELPIRPGWCQGGQVIAVLTLMWPAGKS
jgi:hypothetical protein